MNANYNPDNVESTLIYIRDNFGGLKPFENINALAGLFMDFTTPQRRMKDEHIILRKIYTFGLAQSFMFVRDADESTKLNAASAALSTLVNFGGVPRDKAEEFLNALASAVGLGVKCVMPVQAQNVSVRGKPAPVVIPQGGVPIDEAHFPDANFRKYIAIHFDHDNDGVLNEKEISSVETIDVASAHISSLKGIEHFTNLKSLVCFANKLAELDVSHCTKLEMLDCDDNRLTSLDLSHCTALKMLHCYGNELTSLDVSHCPALKKLWCSDNELTSLDISHCPALEVLGCDYNELTSLDISHCPRLERGNVRCDKNVHITG